MSDMSILYLAHDKIKKKECFHVMSDMSILY